ncbi:hypothetical protein BTR23_14630 [Alkalihalophilus pseudofirmus]|nr:hypothetical protein BTR23_14630 [Alkalihalophilus pseudofirmus]
MNVNFGRLMLQIAKKNKDKIALKNIERNRTYTYMEFHLLTNQICNMIHDRFRLNEGDFFVLNLENDNLSLFNIWTSKGMPTSTWLNYRDSLDEHLYQIDYVKPKLIFIEKEKLDSYYEELKKRNIEIICMDRPPHNFRDVHYFWDLIAEASEKETNVEYDMDEHLAAVKFTGGTTGRGKCVMYTVRTFLSAANYQFAHSETLLDQETKFLHLTPMSHATSVYCFPVFIKGGTNYTINSAELENFCKVVETEGITSTFAVPTLLYRLIDLEAENRFDLSSLKMVVYGASPMSPSKLEHLQEKFGNVFCQLYGSSEAYPLVVLLGLEDHQLTPGKDRNIIASAGRALPGVEVKIVDELGREVSVGENGEIWIRCDAVIKGYYNDPENTALNFSVDGFWKSGDVGYMDDNGYIYIVDRKKDMIISGGFNVYASEVEHVLNAHPGVQQSVVIGIPHEEWGEAVHAEVILKKSSSVMDSELLQYCKAKIASYKVPKTINFVEELPTSAVGKVLRRQVREKYWTNQKRNVH